MTTDTPTELGHKGRSFHRRYQPEETTMSRLHRSPARRIYPTHLTELRPGSYLTDASDLGLAPGEWPNVLEDAAGTRWSFYAAGRAEDGELLGVDYRDADGNELSIIND